MIPVRTSLQNAPSAPMTPAEMEATRARAWIELGIVVLRPDELTDDWLKAGLKQWAARTFGRRMKR